LCNGLVAFLLFPKGYPWDPLFFELHELADLADGFIDSIKKNSIIRKCEKSRAGILILDDDPDITLTFKAGLEKNGFVVTVF
jgi:hypothetical protein